MIRCYCKKVYNMLEKHPCPVCQRELTMKHEIKHIDYHCYPPSLDHHYAERLIKKKMTLVKVRYRLHDGSKFFLKIDYPGGYMEVWTKPNEIDRIRINQIADMDFADHDKMLLKIKTYLTFS